MPQIVRYRRSLARAAFRSLPNRYRRPLTLAYRGYTHFNRYKRSYKTAYKVAKWALKRGGKAAKRRRVGEKPGTSSSKQKEIVNSDSNTGTRSLNATDITKIPLDTNNYESRDARERNIITISGFRYCLHIRNDKPTPMLFHYAIISPKNPVEFGVSPNSDFFRSIGTQGRSINFGTALTAQEFDCLPINPDKFVILKHKKFTIGPNEAAAAGTKYNDHVSRNWAKIDGYEKLKRQIRFDNNANDTPEASPVWFVYWFDGMLEPASSPVVPSAMKVQQKLVTYFRETQRCC